MCRGCHIISHSLVHTEHWVSLKKKKIQCHLSTWGSLHSDWRLQETSCIALTLNVLFINGWNKLAFEGWSLRSSVDIVSSSEQIFCTCPSYSRPFQICMENNVIYSWDRVSLCKGLFRLLIIAVSCVHYSIAHYSSLWQAEHNVTNKSHINGA